MVLGLKPFPVSNDKWCSFVINDVTFCKQGSANCVIQRLACLQLPCVHIRCSHETHLCFWGSAWSSHCPFQSDTRHPLPPVPSVTCLMWLSKSYSHENIKYPSWGPWRRVSVTWHCFMANSPVSQPIPKPLCGLQKQFVHCCQPGVSAPHQSGHPCRSRAPVHTLCEQKPTGHGHGPPVLGGPAWAGRSCRTRWLAAVSSNLSHPTILKEEVKSWDARGFTPCIFTLLSHLTEREQCHFTGFTLQGGKYFTGY